jgi:septum formation protein
MRNKIVLASSSPRRKALLEQIGARFKVLIPGDVEECNSSHPLERVISNASSKVMTVAENLLHGIVIAADTIIHTKGVIMGKPADVADAREMLRILSDNTHSVFTGVAVYDVESKKLRTFVEETKVEVYKLDARVIEKYLSTKEWVGKAGAYAIQGRGALLVKSIKGCFYNVVGLPLSKLNEVLEEYKVSLWQ